MAEELTYVVITPYTIMKSRTGGILARLLSRTDVDLVGAQILTPDSEFAKKYSDYLLNVASKDNERKAKALANYVLENFTPMPDNRKERIMVLIFKGEDACAKIKSVAGRLSWSGTLKKEAITGESIRDTFGDLVLGRDGSLVYFEPAILTPATQHDAVEPLKIIADYAERNQNIAENIVRPDSEQESERTLVIIKPDNWRHPSTKPGNIIDMLSRTGLRIVACKINRMTVAEALEFYGPVKDALRKKLAPIIAQKAKDTLEKELKIKLTSQAEDDLTKTVGTEYADDQFNQIVEFMSGVRPETCPEEDLDSPGKVKSMILIYEGPDAVQKIRNVLGPTDPTKAPCGTVRRDFGFNVMVNTAHASDSQESVQREMRIVKITQNRTSEIIKEFLQQKGL